MRILVIANQTLASAQLARAIRDRAAHDDVSFHIVVPAARPNDHPSWTEGRAKAVAAGRLERTLAWFAEQGLTADGEVGDPRPIDAVRDAMRGGPYDEVILATLPAGVSRWIHQDLPRRVRRFWPGVKTTHLVAYPEPLFSPRQASPR